MCYIWRHLPCPQCFFKMFFVLVRVSVYDDLMQTDVISVTISSRRRARHIESGKKTTNASHFAPPTLAYIICTSGRMRWNLGLTFSRRYRFRLNLMHVCCPCPRAFSHQNRTTHFMVYQNHFSLRAYADDCKCERLMSRLLRMNLPVFSGIRASVRLPPPALARKLDNETGHCVCVNVFRWAFEICAICTQGNRIQSH